MKLLINILYSLSNMIRIIMFSLPMSFVVVFLANLDISLSREIDRRPMFPGPYPCVDPVPLPRPCPQPVVIPQYIPGSGSIFANEPSVTLFTNTFLKAVYATDILRLVFDLSQTPAEQYAHYLTEYTLKVLIAQGFEDPAPLAEWVSRAIILRFDFLPLSIVARVYANAVANFLFVGGYLDINCAKDLGSEYAQAMADSAYYRMNSDSTSKYEALIRGSEDFLRSTVEATKQNAALVAYYVGNEWFVAAVNYGFF